jgi:ribosomal-protein-alanine N-acetyltransferase
MEVNPGGPASALLLTARLRLVAPQEDQAAAVAEFYARNHEHFAPWDPPADAAFHSVDFHRQALHSAALAFAGGSAYRYWLTPIGDATRVIGSVHFSNVVRGAFQSCTLGYALDQAHEGQALMTEALRTAIGEMFSPHVNLHRIQAAFRPENWRSAEVLKRLGFQDEGLASDYLFIDGLWRVHRITALRNPAFVLPDAWRATAR